MSIQFFKKISIPPFKKIKDFLILDLIKFNFLNDDLFLESRAGAYCFSPAQQEL